MTGIRPNPQGLSAIVKDSGVLIENFKETYEAVENYDDLITAIDEAMETSDYLGVTRGGVAFSLENESRIVEYDGRRVRSVGDFTVDSANPQIVTKLLMHTKENLSRLFPMSDVIINPTSGMVKFLPRLGTPQPSDYMTSLSWVRIMGNGDIKINTLINCINTASPAESGADKNESEIDMTFIGNALTYADTAYAPCEVILFPKEVAAPQK